MGKVINLFITNHTLVVISALRGGYTHAHARVRTHTHTHTHISTFADKADFKKPGAHRV